MTPKVEGWTVVLAGYWNPAIFSPEWVIGRLTQAQEVGVEVAIAPAPALRLTFDGLHLRVGQRRLVLGMNVPDPPSLQRMRLVVQRILNDLPHTPVSAIGVNFQFVQREPDAALLRLFDVQDHGPLADAGLVLRETTIQRRFESEGLTLNLQLGIGDEALMFNFNFHHASANAADARAFTEAHDFVVLRDRAVRILHDAYHLEMEEVTA